MRHKKHWYTDTKLVKVPHFLMGTYWRYHVTACGLMRDADDFHADKAKEMEEITCSRCRQIVSEGKQG